ncbi:MAG: phytoene synthase [Xanthomonadaceae bacterium]|nr:phytoene synthase [Xanthomonadaceae bacterium]
MSDSGFESFLGKWLTAEPGQAIALGYLGAAQRDACCALACLEHELIAATYGIREPHVAAVKLNWWGEELARARQGEALHPLTQALFADARAAALPAALYVAPVTAALERLGQGSVPDFDAQLAAAERFHGALAALETAFWYGPEAAPARAARLAALGHLGAALASLDAEGGHERLPLPMALLARHQLTREDLTRPSAARSAALRDQVRALAAAMDAARRLPGPLSLFRSLRARGDRAVLARAQRAADPLAALRAPTRPGLGDAFHLWRAARVWRAAR